MCFQNALGDVKIYSAGFVIRDRRIGSWSVSNDFKIYNYNASVVCSMLKRFSWKKVIFLFLKRTILLLVALYFFTALAL
jgi:hypothetical protein